MNETSVVEDLFKPQGTACSYCEEPITKTATACRTCGRGTKAAGTDAIPVVMRRPVMTGFKFAFGISIFGLLMTIIASVFWGIYYAANFNDIRSRQLDRQIQETQAKIDQLQRLSR